MARDAEIWEAEAKGVKYIKNVLPDANWDPKMTRIFWRCKRQGKRLPRAVAEATMPAVPASVTCSTIRLIRRVDGGDNNAKK